MKRIFCLSTIYIISKCCALFRMGKLPSTSFLKWLTIANFHTSPFSCSTYCCDWYLQFSPRFLNSYFLFVPIYKKSFSTYHSKWAHFLPSFRFFQRIIISRVWIELIHTVGGTVSENESKFLRDRYFQYHCNSHIVLSRYFTKISLAVMWLKQSLLN